MPKAQTILVVEDQKDLRDLVQRCLSGEGFDVIVTGDGQSGLSIAKEHRPDLVVLDLTLPGMDGLDVCRELRRDAQAGRLPVIVLSARGSEADRVLGLDIGADDYLTKPFSARELLARVRAILRRSQSTTSTSTLQKIGDLEIDPLQYEARFKGRTLQLRLSEFRVLQFLVTEPGRVFSRDEIIDAALERDTSVTERTIDVHVNKIRQSLGDSAAHIETVRGVGYRFRPTL